jgi:hypothetical protein
VTDCVVCCVVMSPQVAYRPYLCIGEKKGVLEEHKRKTVEGSRLHAKLDVSLRFVEKMATQKGAQTKTKLGWVDPGATVEETPVLAGIAGFLINYNTVESILLGCAVLINLSGLMFESGQFADERTDGQRLAVTICVIIVLVASITYYIIVLWIDILATLKPATLRRWVAKFHKNPSKILTAGCVPLVFAFVFGLPAEWECVCFLPRAGLQTKPNQPCASGLRLRHG